jgi:ribosome-associated protein
MTARSSSDKLCLDQFLKLILVAGTGGQAKVMIQGGQVRVNGAQETRRRRKLVARDIVEVAGETYPVSLSSRESTSTSERK